MITFDVLEGDATQIPCDALVTCINSAGLWFGGMDGAIQRAAGNMFHAIPGRLHALTDGQIVWAEPNLSNPAPFAAVVFIVDDAQKPIRKLVHDALAVASTNGAKHVVIPGLRTGVMLGIAPEGSDTGIVQSIVEGVNDFEDEQGDAEMTVTFCVYRSPRLAKLFRLALGQPS